MAYKVVALLWDKADKEREFLLDFRDTGLPPGEKGSIHTSNPMSEEKLREELTKLNITKEAADAKIAEARSARPGCGQDVVIPSKGGSVGTAVPLQKRED